jgi:uncharacterized protein DUF6113
MSRPQPGGRPQPSSRRQPDNRPVSSEPVHFHSSALPDQFAAAPERISPGLLALGYAVFAVAGVLSSIYEVLLVPTRWGGSLVPLAPALAIISNIVLPLCCFGLGRTRLSAAPPVIGWVISTLVLSSSRPEGDVLLPAGATAWVSYSLLLGGLLAGLITLTVAGRVRLPINPISRRRVRAGSDSDGVL